MVTPELLQPLCHNATPLGTRAVLGRKEMSAAKPAMGARLAREVFEKVSRRARGRNHYERGEWAG